MNFNWKYIAIPAGVLIAFLGLRRKKLDGSDEVLGVPIPEALSDAVDAIPGAEQVQEQVQKIVPPKPIIVPTPTGVTKLTPAPDLGAYMARREDGRPVLLTGGVKMPKAVTEAIQRDTKRTRKRRRDRAMRRDILRDPKLQGISVFKKDPSTYQKSQFRGQPLINALYYAQRGGGAAAKKRLADPTNYVGGRNRTLQQLTGGIKFTNKKRSSDAKRKRIRARIRRGRGGKTQFRNKITRGRTSRNSYSFRKTQRVTPLAFNRKAAAAARKRLKARKYAGSSILRRTLKKRATRRETPAQRRARIARIYGRRLGKGRAPSGVARAAVQPSRKGRLGAMRRKRRPTTRRRPFRRRPIARVGRYRAAVQRQPTKKPTSAPPKGYRWVRKNRNRYSAWVLRPIKSRRRKPTARRRPSTRRVRRRPSTRRRRPTARRRPSTRRVRRRPSTRRRRPTWRPTTAIRKRKRRPARKRSARRRRRAPSVRFGRSTN